VIERACICLCTQCEYVNVSGMCICVGICVFVQNLFVHVHVSTEYACHVCVQKCVHNVHVNVCVQKVRRMYMHMCVHRMCLHVCSTLCTCECV